MTDIDRTADIEVSRGFAQVTVRLPLTGHVSQEWVSRFGNLAHKWLAHSGNENAFHRHGEDVIEAQDLPDDRSWVIVRLPAAVHASDLHLIAADLVFQVSQQGQWQPLGREVGAVVADDPRQGA
jgi:hypothetical protein